MAKERLLEITPKEVENWLGDEWEFEPSRSSQSEYYFYNSSNNHGIRFSYSNGGETATIAGVNHFYEGDFDNADYAIGPIRDEDEAEVEINNVKTSLKMEKFG